MKSPQGTTWSPHLVFCTIVLYLTFTIQASDQCAPSIWQPGQFMRRQLSTPTPTASPNASISVSSSSGAQPTANITISPIITTGNISPGQVNCRYTSSTEGLDINYYTCTQLANQYGISIETFFTLNPGLHPDCGNIQPDTDYCVRGFIEPVRATAGLCGPPNNNATCLGTQFQCCNAKTWTCGNSTGDCAAGTCYEGACAGDSVYTTTGDCGRQHGYRQCAGVWGDCCNADGKCGTGESFCGFGVCQLGNCTIPAAVPSPPSWLNGNTTDGTCGGTNSFTCNVVYGNCCNKNGMCGSLPSDCRAGCQPQWGNCSSSITGPSSSTFTTSGPITTSGPGTSSAATKTSSPTTPISSSLPPSTSIPGEAALPSCGQLCFNNMLAQYSTLGCNALDAYCLCNNVDFSNGLRDCSNGACGTAVGSTAIAFGSAYCSSATATHTGTTIHTTTTSSSLNPTSIPGEAALPACGQLCFNNMLAQYATLGCSALDAYCLCNNADFSNGLRDCSNGACGTAVGSTAIAFGSAYCSSAQATHTATATGLAVIPSCGQLCFNNMLAQYSSLGCSTAAPACICSNVNFGYGLRDCSNGACGTAVASTVIAYGSSYCASATGVH